MNNSITQSNNEGLIAPLSYWQAKGEKLDDQINGCGPSHLPSWIVPDSLIGVRVTESCNIHDWMYYKALSNSDLKKADEIFLKNLNRQIGSNKSVFNISRRTLSYIYFSAVRIYSTLKYHLFGIKKR
ncbi:MAG: hypothetical protein ACJAS4_003068 [Bacteriovoracaceae bacterium]